MKFGAVFPTNFGNDTIFIRDFVQTVEGLGYDYILTYEQIIDSACPEPLTLMSYMAALTNKLDFATGVTVLASRQTILVAKQVAQLDRLCGGRLRYGVSAGWNQTEFQAMAVDYQARGKRLDEQIILLRKLWSEPSVTFTGKYHTLENIGILPKPLQQRIPIWMGGSANAVFKRIATLGDGWLADSETPDSILPKLDTIKRYAEAAGRNPADIGLEIVDVKPEATRDWSKWVQDWESVGAGYMSVTTRHAQLQTSQQHFDHFTKFIKSVR
jgi:probable F420-dependent oxidoreductase